MQLLNNWSRYHSSAHVIPVNALDQTLSIAEKSLAALVPAVLVLLPAALALQVSGGDFPVRHTRLRSPGGGRQPNLDSVQFPTLPLASSRVLQSVTNTYLYLAYKAQKVDVHLVARIRDCTLDSTVRPNWHRYRAFHRIPRLDDVIPFPRQR
jgi:hypothetical protein